MARSPRSNRTDLLSPPQPPTAVPGQGYGRATDQLEAQRIAPMAGGATQLPGAPASSAPQAPQGAPGPQDLLAQTLAHNGPGDAALLSAPTARPNEPVTHGLPGGPGAGPEALTGVGAAARENAVEQGTLKNLLTNLSTQPNASSAVKALAALATSGAQ